MSHEVSVVCLAEGWSKAICVCVAAGYNNVEVAEYLLENNADVNAQDKGGLIPLHNASSYGEYSCRLRPLECCPSSSHGLADRPHY